MFKNIFKQIISALTVVPPKKTVDIVEKDDTFQDVDVPVVENTPDTDVISPTPVLSKVDKLNDILAKISKPAPVLDYPDKNSNTFFLVRKNYNKNETIGHIVFLTGERIPSLECPWLDNKIRLSCIPEGKYVVKKRVSGIVNRTTKRRAITYTSGWEVTNVPTRTYIMFHIGNTAKDIVGCIAMGLKHGKLGGANAVLSSGDAFDIFMKRMSKHTTWNLVVLTESEFNKLTFKK